MLNRTIAPPIKEPIDFKIELPVCDKRVLKNGIEVYSLNMGTEDTLMINWVFDAGSWYEKKKSVAAATNFLLKNGTQSRNAFQLNEHFEYYGAYLNRSCYSESAEITLHTLNKHVKELIPVVAELLQESIFPDEELAIFIQNSSQRLKVGLRNADFVAGRLIDSYVFGEDHPYGKYNNLEDYAALTRQDVLSFYNDYYKNGTCVIFVAGKLPEGLFEQLETHFGSLPLGKFDRSHRGVVHVVKPFTEKKHFVTNDPDSVQASIRIARPFPNRKHPDFQKVMVLNNVFGGFFGSRLSANIREDKGYTYGIYSYLMNLIETSSWIVSTEAGREVSQATIDEVYNEMEILREEEVDEEELQMVKNYMIGSILGDLDGPFQVIGRWKNLVLNGLEPNYFYDAVETIRQVQAPELKELANKYLVPSDFYELVVV